MRPPRSAGTAPQPEPDPELTGSAIASPARTVVDCFRYRNKVGIDVAMEALRDAIRSRKATIAEIGRVAGVCRQRTVMKPYLEAFSA